MRKLLDLGYGCRRRGIIYIVFSRTYSPYDSFTEEKGLPEFPTILQREDPETLKGAETRNCVLKMLLGGIPSRSC